MLAKLIALSLLSLWAGVAGVAMGMFFAVLLDATASLAGFGWKAELLLRMAAVAILFIIVIVASRWAIRRIDFSDLTLEADRD